MKNPLLFVFGLLFFVEVNAQPKTIYGLKISKLISSKDSSVNSFYMDETPITYEDFEIYVQAGGKKNAYWFYDSYHIKEQPVTGISWFQAAEYCNWRSLCEGLKPVYKETKKWDSNSYMIFEKDSTANGYRLPTTEEFEIAASGNNSSKNYPWGNRYNDSISNRDIDSGFLSKEWWRLAPVKLQYKNDFGLYNMCGNNWHWCDDWADEKKSKKLKGGSWGTIAEEDLKISYTSNCSPANYNYDIGFRCVRNANSIKDSIIKFDTTISFEFRKSYEPVIVYSVHDFYGEEIKIQLTEYIEENYPECINLQMKVDEQEILTPSSMAELIIKVCQRNNINPLFLTSIMISESGFGTVSFPRWYNNPMAYMWQNKLMANGYPTYENKPGKTNRKYKTLEEGFEMFCKGIRRDIYYKAAKRNLDAFHLIYVGYRADEWMNTMTRIYRDIAGVRFEPKFPEGDAGKYIYTDWEEIKKNLK